jgi:hypothetical protein
LLRESAKGLMAVSNPPPGANFERVWATPMWKEFLSLCQELSPHLFYAVRFSDISTGIAYFGIPSIMLYLLYTMWNDIDYPRIWVLFAAFIYACGASHVIHGFMDANHPLFLLVYATNGIGMAMISNFTMVVLAYSLPIIMRTPSPERIRKALEIAVEKEMQEKNALLMEKNLLLMEINHNFGNKIQIMCSIASIYRRRIESGESIEINDILGLMDKELGKMCTEHHKRSGENYMGF